MTDPQPAPDQGPASPPGHDPWAATTAAGRPGGGEDGAQWPGEIRDGLLVTVPTAILTGLVLGLVWFWWSPRVPLVHNGEAVLLADSEGQQAIGSDGLFLLAGLGVGAVAGVAVHLLRRRAGAGTVVGLAAGSLLGALLAWRFGIWLGPTQDVLAHARDVGEGVRFDAPLELGAKGVLLGLPFAAVGVHMFCTAAWMPREAAPTPAELPHWQSPQWEERARDRRQRPEERDGQDRRDGQDGGES
ncbi:ABC transporter permease [Streptomyces sp. NPDC049881]|uniref:ABC transporter permease n=1 Tax=Streptomyces sp. NPDC049881 TaxID=3155778 RepID=UPI00341E9576